MTCGHGSVCGHVVLQGPSIGRSTAMVASGPAWPPDPRSTRAHDTCLDKTPKTRHHAGAHKAGPAAVWRAPDVPRTR